MTQGLYVSYKMSGSQVLGASEKIKPGSSQKLRLTFISMEETVEKQAVTAGK